MPLKPASFDNSPLQTYCGICNQKVTYALRAKEDIKCSQRSCQQKGHISTYCFFHCSKRHVLHTKHIEELKRDNKLNFLEHCPVCEEKLNQNVSAKLFLDFGLSENEFDDL
jgi:hypothetical protein